MILSNGPEILPGALPDTLRTAGNPPKNCGACTLEELEKQHIGRMIEATASLQEAAEKLGIDQTTLWRKRKQYGL